MKKYRKIFIIGLTVLLIMFNNNVFAFSDIWEMANDFINPPTVTSPAEVSNAITGITDLNNNISSEFEVVLDFVWGFGLLVIFISTIILGIKYMFVDPGEKSKIKQATTPYVISVVIIFGAVTIWKLVIYILESML